METERIGIIWQLSDHHGWGVFGTNLALNLIKNGPRPPQLFCQPSYIQQTPENAETLTPFIEELSDQDINTDDFSATTLLHSLGNQFVTGPLSKKIKGRRNVGFTFFEKMDFDSELIARARQWDRILSGSSWCRDLCHGAGLSDVRFVSQGVDIDNFSPAPSIGVPSNRFVVFSGGKLEYRKGQDIVLAAFKQFHARHPDSLLVTAWHNPWGQTALDMAQSRFAKTPPELDADGTILIDRWAKQNGLAEGSFIDLGWVANARLPSILRETHIALFPNRCEGGTNLAAMEAMASGIPCILSANSGHLDLIDGDNCYVLHKQSTDPAEPSNRWESDIDEIVDALEQAYSDAEVRQQRGQAGAIFMRELSWENQVAKLIHEIEDLL
jgi:glycosyltransferase involved in cell wall biosynthesis